MPDLRVLVQNKYCTLLGAFHLFVAANTHLLSLSKLVGMPPGETLSASSLVSSVSLIHTLHLLPANFIPSAHPVSRCGVVVIFYLQIWCAWWVVFFLALVFKVLLLFPSKAAPQHGPLHSSVTGRRGKSRLWTELWFQLCSDMVHGWLKSHVVPQGGWLLCWSGQDFSLTARCAKWGCRLWLFESLGKLTKGLQLQNQGRCAPLSVINLWQSRRHYLLLQSLLSWRKGHQKLLMLKNISSFSRTSEPFGWNLCKKIQPQAGIWCGKFQPKLLFWQSCKAMKIHFKSGKCWTISVLRQNLYFGG